MPNPALPLLVAGGAALLLLGGKKKRRTSSISFDEGEVVTGGLHLPSNESVAFTPDLDQFKIGPTWRIRVLDQWLNERRKAGKLATVDHDAGWFYDLVIHDPSTFIGEITGLGETGGDIIYSALWLMATSGVSLWHAGAAWMRYHVQAGHHLGKLPEVYRRMGRVAGKIVEEKRKWKIPDSEITRWLELMGDAEMAHSLGILATPARYLSVGATKSGAAMAAGVLAEAGVNEAYSQDLAASAIEAAADFMESHDVNIGRLSVPIALLPPGEDYPAVQEFNKIIMNYIVKFQHSTFED
jgi:hypothetical protein